MILKIMSPFYRAAVYKMYIDRHCFDVSAISYRHYAAAYKNSIVVERGRTGLISISTLFFPNWYIEMFSLREIMLIYSPR